MRSCSAEKVSWARIVVLLGIAYGCSLGDVIAADPADSWPTYRHDNRRSGVTSQSLAFPLQRLWTRPSTQPPQPAWTGPAKWDAYSGNSGLQSMRNFDPCFYVTAAAGLVHFGSSVVDAAIALDAATGKERWVRFTGAAVRLPPTLHEGLALFGSDDGFVYACHADTGEVAWSKRASLDKRRITSDRKIISLGPVRSGVLVQDGRACFASSLVPWQPSLLWSVNAKTGSEVDPSAFRRELTGVTLQGAMLASQSRLYVPQGRSPPLSFDLADGEPLGAIGQTGGVFCVLTDDEMLIAGPPDQKGRDDQLRIADAGSNQRLASFSGTRLILVDGDLAWVPSGGKLKMLDRQQYVDAQQAIDSAQASLKRRKENKAGTDTPAVEDAQRQLEIATGHRDSAWRWAIDCPTPTDLIKAGNAIIVGGENQVQAFDAESGRPLWLAAVEGTVYGLAVAEGRLFVSTGRGHIDAFGALP